MYVSVFFDFRLVRFTKAPLTGFSFSSFTIPCTERKRKSSFFRLLLYIGAGRFVGSLLDLVCAKAGTHNARQIKREDVIKQRSIGPSAFNLHPIVSCAPPRALSAE